MHKKKSLYKLILLLLIPVVGIAFMVYRRSSRQPKISEQHEHMAEHQHAPQHEPEVTQQASQETPHEEQITREETPAFSAQELATRETPEPIKEIAPSKTKPSSPRTPSKPAPKPSPRKDKSEKKAPAAKPDEAARRRQEVQEPAQATKEITLTDDLVKKSLGYKHWTGWYYPTKWELKLNDELVLTFDGKEFTHVKRKITLDPTKPLKAYFDFEFLHGKRKGWKQVMYQVDPNANNLKIDFDWKEANDHQILISPAKFLSIDSHNNHDGK